MSSKSLYISIHAIHISSGFMYKNYLFPRNQEHVEDIEEKAYLLYKERAQVKKINLKEEMEKKEQRKQERLQKKIDKSNAPKKTPGRPKGYSPKKNGMVSTSSKLYVFST